MYGQHALNVEQQLFSIFYTATLFSPDRPTTMHGENLKVL
jgi:hypothetical protein